MKTLMKAVCAVRHAGEFSALANGGNPQVFSGHAVKQVLASVIAILTPSDMVNSPLNTRLLTVLELI